MTTDRSVRGIRLALWIALCAGGGALIGMVTEGGGSPWYASLEKPSWTPPGWVFAPVWTALYAAMGIAAWLVWREGGWRQQRLPLTVFLVQLAVNFAWSPLFFWLRQITWALVDIVVLWILIAITMRVFVRVNRPTAWLLSPYLAWVSFATALNAAIVWMNKGV